MLTGSAEDIPLESNSFDTVVMTWTLCSVTDPVVALSEIKRVIKPGGKVIFAEHGKSPDQNIRKLQKTLNPLWSRIAGGCQLNRDIVDLYESSGFKFKSMERTKSLHMRNFEGVDVRVAALRSGRFSDRWNRTRKNSNSDQLLKRHLIPPN
mgnify:CR=1 FL=1